MTAPRKGVRVTKGGVLCALAGTVLGLGISAGLEAPTKPAEVKVKTIEVPKPIVKEVPGEDRVLPLPESCERTITYAGYLQRHLNKYYRPAEKAMLVLEQELMPAALLGNVADLNDANIKFRALMDQSADVLYYGTSADEAMHASLISCEKDLAKALDGDDDYEPADGVQLSDEELDSVFSD